MISPPGRNGRPRSANGKSTRNIVWIYGRRHGPWIWISPGSSEGLNPAPACYCFWLILHRYHAHTMPPGAHYRYAVLLARKLTISVTCWRVYSVASNRNLSGDRIPGAYDQIIKCIIRGFLYEMNCNNSVVFCSAISSSHILFTGTGGDESR